AASTTCCRGTSSRQAKLTVLFCDRLRKKGPPEVLTHSGIWDMTFAHAEIFLGMRLFFINLFQRAFRGRAGELSRGNTL
ncbi:hypothetical protein, partial [uncultured Paracoccus sp.]|uniref:hypothetical protein n=1 Tax=uncultured Paracoccus sp. TaxID=189685 RepID=UPI00261EA36B